MVFLLTEEHILITRIFFWGGAVGNSPNCYMVSYYHDSAARTILYLWIEKPWNMPYLAHSLDTNPAAKNQEVSSTEPGVRREKLGSTNALQLNSKGYMEHFFWIFNTLGHLKVHDKKQCSKAWLILWLKNYKSLRWFVAFFKISQFTHKSGPGLPKIEGGGGGG